MYFLKRKAGGKENFNDVAMWWPEIVPVLPYLKVVSVQTYANFQMISPNDVFLKTSGLLWI